MNVAKHTERTTRTLGAERLAREIANAAPSLDDDVIFDANPAERRELVDELPVDEPRARARAQRAEQSVDEVEPRLDGEDLTDLDGRRIPEEAIFRARRPRLHADVVHDHAERVAEPVRQEHARDAAIDELAGTAQADAELD